MSLALAATNTARYTPTLSAPSARASGSSAGQAGSNGLSRDEQAAVRKLEARDREVRQHEQAHLAAAGGLAVSGASFTYQRGPDGKNYAVGGEVQIDTSEGRTAQETVQKAEQIRAAALAPASPSGQDRAVAAEATQMASKARAELAQQRSETGAVMGNDERGNAERQSAINKAYGTGAPSAQAGFSAYA